MTDYARGFNDGFAAAVRTFDRSSTGAKGFIDECSGKTKKISIGFEHTLFDRINAVAHDAGQSFSATVRNIVRNSIAA